MLEELYLVPVGEVEGEILDYLYRELEETFGRSCMVAAPLAHPHPAYSENREEYLSSYILQQLAQLELPHAFRVLGVADLDLYIPELNFVFGQAAKGGRDGSSLCPGCGRASTAWRTMRRYSANGWSKKRHTSSATPSASITALTGLA